MLVSDREREELKRRVAARLSHRSPGAHAISEAVDAVVGGLAAAAEVPVARDDSPGREIVIVTAESMPDLASRLRGKMSGGGSVAFEVAREGRHTVVVAHLDAAERAALQAAAVALGVQMITKEHVSL